MLLKIYWFLFIWRNCKFCEICSLTLEKLNVERLQWIDLNNSKLHWIYKASDFRNKFCQFNCWNYWLDQHWKRQKMSDVSFLKFWVFENCSTGSIFVYIFHVIHGFSNLSNHSVGIALMKKLMLEAYNFSEQPSTNLV